MKYLVWMILKRKSFDNYYSFTQTVFLFPQFYFDGYLQIFRETNICTINVNVSRNNLLFQ